MDTSHAHNLFTYDFIAKEIRGSNAAFNKASKGYGDAYNELIEKMNSHPDFKCVANPPKKRTTRAKETYSGCSIHFIKDYVEMKDTPKYTKEMENIIAFCKKNNENPLPKLRSWLIDAFKYEYVNERFSMAEAKEEVRKWRLTKSKAGEPASVEANDTLDEASGF